MSGFIDHGAYYIKHLDNKNYFPMEYSKIFLSIESFLDLQNKFATQEHNNEKKIK